MYSILGELFSSRQISYLERVPDVLASFFADGMTFKRFIATVLFIFQLPLSFLFDFPAPAVGPEVDLSSYEMVFCDDFEGDTLNTDVWYTRGNGKRRGGFNADSQVKIVDGNAVMTGEYLTDGEFGEGWYAGAIALKEKYTYGYFEIRCICNPGGGFWSAFWLQAEHPYTPEISKGGVGGAEIDIFEAMDYGDFINGNSVIQTIHCSGMEGDTSGELNSRGFGRYNGNNIYSEYNTYGLEWTEDEYIFYVNGVETARTSFADGVSKVPEEVIASLELPEDIAEKHEKDFKTQFVVDYVKIYQKK